MNGSLMSTPSIVLWCVNGLLALVLALGGFVSNREIVRNDEQETRIRAVEQSCVKLEGMQHDIAEMKNDLKTLLRRQ